MKTFEDIKTLAMNEPTIHRALMMFYDGNLTREQALIEMVFVLSEQKKQYFDEIVKLNMTRPNPPIMG